MRTVLVFFEVLRSIAHTREYVLYSQCLALYMMLSYSLSIVKVGWQVQTSPASHAQLFLTALLASLEWYFGDLLLRLPFCIEGHLNPSKLLNGATYCCYKHLRAMQLRELVATKQDNAPEPSTSIDLL